MKVSRISCALLLILVLGMLTDIQAEVLHREKRDLPRWIAIRMRIVRCRYRRAAAAAMMGRAYVDMIQAEGRNCDKYFHCRGNYDAAQLGWCGRRLAAAMSDAREWMQGEADGEEADQEANLYGRNGGDCVQKYIKDTMGMGADVECSLPEDRW